MDWLNASLSREARHMGVPFAGASLVICSVLALMLVFSNLLPVLAVLRTKRLQRPCTLLLALMAASDVLSAMSLLLTTFYVKIFRHEQLTCSVAIVCVFPVTLSALCICAISGERLIALRAPYWYRKHVTNTAVCVLFFVLVIFTFSCSLVQGLNIRENYDDEEQCNMSDRVPQELYKVLLLVISGLFPLVFLLLANIAIIVLVRRHNKKHPRTSISPAHSKAQRQLIQENKATRVSLTVVAVMFICTAPYLAFSLFMDKKDKLDPDFPVYNRIYFCTMVLLYVNNCANPWVYCVRLRGFRRAYATLFRSCKRTRVGVAQTESNSNYIPPVSQALSRRRSTILPPC